MSSISQGAANGPLPGASQSLSPSSMSSSRIGSPCAAAAGIDGLCNTQEPGTRVDIPDYRSDLTLGLARASNTKDPERL